MAVAPPASRGVMMADFRGYSIQVVSADGAMRGALEGALRDLGHAVEAFAGADEYLMRGAEQRADCLMLDQDLPDAVASELHHRVRGAVVRVPVICVAVGASTASVVRAMRAGALDFLCAPFGRDDLARSVAAAAEVSRAWREEDEGRARLRVLLGRLSPRERAVLALVMEGKRNKQIAACLGSQEATVKVHRSRLMRKLEVHSLVELIRMGRELDVASWPEALSRASAATTQRETRSVPAPLVRAVGARNIPEFLGQFA